MKTIEIILKQAWYTREYLIQTELDWITNWMWAKWGIQFTDEARKFKAFESKKAQELLDNLDLVSNIHDLEYAKWGWIKAFYKSNLDLINRVLILLYWTSILRRLLVFIIMFFSLNTIWAKAFNWKG